MDRLICLQKYVNPFIFAETSGIKPIKNSFKHKQLCKVIPGQAVNKKLDDSQTTNVIRYAATDTSMRISKIEKAVKTISHYFQIKILLSNLLYCIFAVSRNQRE